MKPFEYAAPRLEDQIVGLLSPVAGESEILAGGTDLVPLMSKMLVTPRRVVNIKEVRSLRGVEQDSQGVVIGAVTHLDELLEDRALDAFQAIRQVIADLGSLQMQSQGTLGGELCQRPRCWYFRNGHGLLAENGNLVSGGDNRFHAIFANKGPAKFVSASRLAPAMIASGAQVRLIGPTSDDETIMPLEALYRIPRNERERETILEPNQVVTHILLPTAETGGRLANGTYEVRHGEGPDDPLVTASVGLEIESGLVKRATVVLGQVAPIPWVSTDAAQALVGLPVDPQTAEQAAAAAVASATPLSNNGYKVQLARTCVRRAILRAVGLETGGF